MLFPSFEFLFYFLPLLLLSYHAMPNRGRRALLAIASYFFYGWWDYRFIGLLWLSTVIDYLAGGAIHRTDDPRRRKRWLIVSVIANLGVLGFFKYFAFANRSLAAMFELLGAGYPRALLDVHVILPIGISFFTFQSMSYTIDIYRRKVRPAASFVDFACYISLFPQLIAGPIVRYSMMEDQLRRPEISTGRFYLGMQFFIIGLAKKVLLADNLAPLADRFFDAPNLLVFGTPDAVLAVLAYSLQIYFDFSGYSDMAVGLGYFLGYGFPKNFDSPYKALSFREFWRRWHITLSTWLRDYLYISLGGSRRGRWKTYRNLLLTMLLGGLWHGANWTFFIWGAWHGALLALERAMGKRNPLRFLPRRVKQLGVFALVCLGWVFFRSGDLQTALIVFARLFGGGFGETALLTKPFRLPLLTLAVGLFIAFGRSNSWELAPRPHRRKTIALALLFLTSLLFLFGSVTHPFLYFQF